MGFVLPVSGRIPVIARNQRIQKNQRNPKGNGVAPGKVRKLRKRLNCQGVEKYMRFGVYSLAGEDRHVFKEF